jgi:hypothetical protein
MRRAICLTLLLAACIPSSDRRLEPVARDQRTPGRELLQCHADLSREGVRYKALPDREFGAGCTAIGAVQLLDIGTPSRISAR